MNGIEVTLCVGSNDKCASDNVTRAIACLDTHLRGLKSSGCYETKPLSGTGANYVNAVISGIYYGSLDELEHYCKNLEYTFGRDEQARAQKRVPLDVDIVIADNQVLRPLDYNYDYFQQGWRKLSIPDKFPVTE